MITSIQTAKTKPDHGAENAMVLRRSAQTMPDLGQIKRLGKVLSQAAGTKPAQTVGKATTPKQSERTMTTPNQSVQTMPNPGQPTRIVPAPYTICRRIQFPKIRPLIFWLILLLLYSKSILSYCHYQQEPSISILLSGTYPDQETVLNLLDEAENQQNQTPEDVIPSCFYWDGGMAQLQNPEHGRNSEAMVGGLYGDASLYDWRLNGFAPEDTEGCVLDKQTAAELFGTTHAEGQSLTLKGNTYQVRAVLPWKQQLILIRPNDKTNLCTRVFLKEKGKSATQTARQFLNSSGLSGNIAGGDFLRPVSICFLLLLPASIAATMLRQALRERRTHTEKEPEYWLWTAACLLVIAAAAAFLWKNIQIPADWIPSQWSNFSFWSEKIQDLSQELRLYLILPKTALQAENLLTTLKTALWSLAALLLWQHRRTEK